MNGNGWVPPDQLVRALEESAVALDGLGKELHSAHDALVEAELAWDLKYDEIVESLQDECEIEGKSLPGEDVRRSLARRHGGWDLWAAMRRADRRVKSLDKQISVADKAISARQSELKQMQIEDRVA